MKNLKLLFSFLMMMVVCSCSNVNKEMLEMIPADVVFSASLNTVKAADHFGIKVENDKIVLPTELTAQIDAKQSGEIDSLCNMLSQIGLDIDTNVYMFVTSGEQPFFVMLVPINDAKQAQDVLSKHDSKRFVFTEEDGIAFADCVAIKDHVLLVSEGNEGKKEDVKKLFAKKFDNITSVSDAEKTLNADGDYNVYVNYVQMFANYDKMIQMGGTVAGKVAGYISVLSSMMKGVDGLAINVKLDDNEIEVESKLFAENTCDFIKLLEAVKGAPSTDFLKYMPADANLLYGVAINGKNLSEFEGVKSLLSMAGANIKGLDLVKLVSSISGIGFGVKSDMQSGGMFVSFCMMTNMGADLEKLMNGFGVKSPGLEIKSTGNAFVLTYSMNSVNSVLDNQNEEAKELFGKYFSAGLVNLPVSNMTMHFETCSDDVKKTDLEFYIKSGDKKMKFFEYPNYFSSLNELLNNYYKASGFVDKEKAMALCPSSDSDSDEIVYD